MSFETLSTDHGSRSTIDGSSNVAAAEPGDDDDDVLDGSKKVPCLVARGECRLAFLSFRMIR